MGLSSAGGCASSGQCKPCLPIFKQQTAAAANAASFHAIDFAPTRGQPWRIGDTHRGMAECSATHLYRVALCPSSCRRSEEHTSELQSLMGTSYAVFCLAKKKYIACEKDQLGVEHQNLDIAAE